MKKLLSSLIITLMAITVVFAQHTDKSQVSVEKQNQWIRKTAGELKKFVPDSTLPVITLQKYVFDDGQKLSCRVIENGIIRLDNGGWIYITTTSGHDDKEIGDVSLAIDHNKNIYKNYGHVCGGIIHFETTQLTGLKTTTEFFEKFVSDTDSAKWEKVK